MSSYPDPGSPSLLDSPPPASPDTVNVIDWEPSQRLHVQDSETFTQPVHPETSNDSEPTQLFTIEDRNTGIVPWVRSPHRDPGYRNRRMIDEDSSSMPASVFNENRNFEIPRFAISSEESNSSSNIVLNDIARSPMRDSNRKSQEPPAKIRKLSPSKVSSFDEEQDGETCPICLDVWGNSGEHRLVALKCGHLFGAQCVERWLRAQLAKDRSCPTCKSKASLKDIRFIFARRLIAADTAEITNLQKQLETVQAEKCRTELELQKSKIAHMVCLRQLDQLRSSAASRIQGSERGASKGWRFALEKNLEVLKDGCCRVLAYNCRTYELYVSQKSTNSIFPGYGVRKVSCVDYRLGAFVHLHPKAIRDMAYSHEKDLLLSASLDSTARILERGISSVVVQCGAPLWSATWNILKSEEFYVGTASGTVLHYDIRNTASPFARLSTPGVSTPVVSLYSSEHGLLACQLNSCWLRAPEGEPAVLPVDGRFMSMCYDAQSSRLAVAARPQGHERAKISICRVRAAGTGDAACEVEQVVAGSARASVMSRGAWVRADGATWLAAHSESDEALLLHGVEGARPASLPAREPALDVRAVTLPGGTLLAALSDARLRIYKAVPVTS